MELRHLRYFVAVVEAQSFTKAAEKLFIAQPPLSRQIQNLEQELGAPLFERGSRPLRTTAVGHFFYQQALKLLSNAEEIKLITQRAGMTERTIQLGYSSSLLCGLLPRIVYLFRQQHPNLNIKLLELNGMAQIQALKEGRVDVCFGRVRISDPAVKRVQLREERLMAAVHSSHPFANQRRPISLAELNDEQIFSYPSQAGPGYAVQVKSLFLEYGLEPKRFAVLDCLQQSLGMVAAGEGICIVPESVKMMQFRHVNYLPLADSAAVSPIYLIVRNDDEGQYTRPLFDCVYQVYDLEAIEYDRRVF
ncbi:LysR family transcriptional regulator [Acinetobacter sp.]|uniref:LysR family transcriptional regulator n=1 Tax=Acinetobacter sp. TaxID=472 RepID=UPI002FCA8DD0